MISSMTHSVTRNVFDHTIVSPTSDWVVENNLWCKLCCRLCHTTMVLECIVCIELDGVKEVQNMDGKSVILMKLDCLSGDCSQGHLDVCIYGGCCKLNKEFSTECN